MRGSFSASANGPGPGRIEVNGHDISNAVHRADVTFEADEIPQVEIQLQVVDVTSLGSSEVELFISSDVHAALVKLGWTPPPEET